MRGSGSDRTQTLQGPARPNVIIGSPVWLSSPGKGGPYGQTQRWDGSFTWEVRSVLGPATSSPGSAVPAASRGKVDLRSRYGSTDGVNHANARAPLLDLVG